MMDNINDKTTQWTCDQCGNQISCVEDGYVEWLSYKNEESKYKSKDIRIVHSIDCLYNDDKLSSGMDLKSFSETDGLMNLLEFISEDRFDDKEEVLEIIKRIHIPGYEKVRNSMDEAIGEGIFEPNRKPGYYTQRDINSVIRHLEK